MRFRILCAAIFAVYFFAAAILLLQQRRSSINNSIHHPTGAGHSFFHFFGSLFRRVLNFLADAVDLRADALRLLRPMASAIGVPGEALLLFLSILAGYPLAWLYRTRFYASPPRVQHIYFTVVGLLLHLLNSGPAVFHSLLSILLAYLIVNYLPGYRLSVLLAHVCFMGHLLLGYWFMESESYDINWTIPFCVMTLRFIGLVMDVYDGHRNGDLQQNSTSSVWDSSCSSLSSSSSTDSSTSQPPSPTPTNQRPNHPLLASDSDAIYDEPGLLEIAAYGLFFSGTLVGPQFPLRRFRCMVHGAYLENEARRQVRKSSIMACLQRFAAGVCYAALHIWGVNAVPNAYFTSAEFFNTPFHWKIIWNIVWFRATMYRYLTCWLLTEGANILCGLAYNGKDSKGNDRWDGVRDIHILRFELGRDYTHIIRSFNCGTNTFARNHIFKRLRWVGNKHFSQFTTLAFLALWHGYHIGYYIMFAYEFACIVAQEQFYAFLRHGPPAVRRFLHKWWMRPVCWLLSWFALNASMAFAFFPFGLVTSDVWIVPLKTMYFYSHLLYGLVWPLFFHIALRPMIKTHRP